MWNVLGTDAVANPGWPIEAGPLRVRAGVVTLRPVQRRDGRDWSALRLGERDHLEPWEPTVDGQWRDNNTARAWPPIHSQLRRYARAGASLPAAIEVDGRFCGQLTVGGIVRGALHSGWIGYWVGRPFGGGGVATAALALGLDHALGPGALHRIDATVRPENTASRVVLERCGFREEGLLQRYLHVDGAWRDHLLVARTRDEHGRGAAAALVASGFARRV
ncbi:GNAT family N-acetyltransferase [Dietzia psychralcaliphila]|uniref:GCN5 family acetyltransferase n=1 Tax=Dietzia psychralcaliphila TaxID=139021 RepID=A0AAD0JQL3_9ACTN|nr:GNAT family protein [Dietzia psychralcaliphila]AWH96065.1 GCN5 family acetyltransferase [Dietzia psychralcaliphila]PTM90888.1 ribosomal-protein-alanine N-acetyltransferase [Dietzia psychralcaliphila]